jgi:6-pyruvoyltetrahydropterin/6-carboxytetrahydropterin synthase
MDFAELKRLLKEITAPFDHRNLNEIPPFDRLNPTAEHLARHIAEETARRLPPGPAVRRVEVWETATSCAIYEPDS